MTDKKVLVVGATGLVGAAAVRHLCAQGQPVIAAARRQSALPDGAQALLVDLNDRVACEHAFSALTDVTHIVYAALYEAPELVSGWSDAAQIEVNDRMFRNVLDPFMANRGALRHVTLLQGTKAYGLHVRAMPTPAREDRDELRSQPNFYWAQEDHLRACAQDAAWTWTVLRPTLIVGGGVGGAMNLAPAIGVFAALLKAEGMPFAFPGGGPRIAAAADVDLVARAIAWSGETQSARNRTFNVTNGDVYVWAQLWPALADFFEMPSGEPEPRSVEAFCRPRAKLWDALRRQHELIAPALDAFVGPSLQYCDYQFRFGQPDPGPASLVSTVNIMQAGFTDVIDTEQMFLAVLAGLREQRFLPGL